MSSTLPLVLRLPRLGHSKEEAEFVLVHVSSDGRNPLDLKLIGTESSAVFSVSLKHNQTSSLKAKNSPVNKEEWEQILSSVLFGATEDGHGDITRGVEAVAKIDNNLSSIAITIQKRIEGITQKLGTITVPANEDADVELYEWCGLTVQSRDTSRQELEALKTELREKEERIKRLDDSFAELVKVKNEHENDLLEKFSILLNEKKLKIRDQQRLLAGANIDPENLQSVERSRTSGASGPAGPSRSGKRKAGNNARGQIEEEESDDEFEKMDVDVKEEAENDSEQDQPQTPDESTADEASEDETPLVSHPTRSTVNKAEASRQQKSTMPSASSTRLEDDVPPPPRELPFAKKKAAPPAPPPVEGSETESDDDEL